MEQTECCLGGIRLSGVLRPKQVASVGAQTKTRAWAFRLSSSCLSSVSHACCKWLPPPAVPYHTPLRARLSTPNNDPVARNAQYITNKNARPSVVSDNRRCQAAQAASGNANSSWSGSHVLPHMTLVASCGVFVIFRGAERFVFRARTDPKDAMPRRRCGEGRANITSSEAELNGRLRPSNRGRRHGVVAYPPPKAPEGIARWGAEPPVRTRIFVFQPGGLGWTG